MSGSVTAIIGPMYASKSTELQRFLRRAEIASKKISMFKPVIDNRYSESEVVTHDGLAFPAHSVSSTQEIWDIILDEAPDVVGFDEAQFFDSGLIGLVDRISIAPHNIDVFVAGLDTDFKGDPFKIMSPLVMRADNILKLTAICLGCGGDATRTQRVIGGEPSVDGDIVSIGGVESYEARCRHCFVSSR